MQKVIDSFSGKYECFSNFSAHPVGQYATAEHRFQAKKATNQRDHDYVAEANSPRSAKWRGRQIKLRADWEQAKDPEMLRTVIDKVHQHRDVADILVSTDNVLLIEGNYHKDDYWGMVKDKDGNWTGLNMLGKALMVARGMLKREREDGK